MIGTTITKTKTLYPVSLDEVKQHLRIDLSNTEDDDYISKSIIKSATRKAENFIGKDIALTTVEYKVYDFCGDSLFIPEGNLISLNYVISDASVAQSVSDVRAFDDRFYFELSTSLESDPIVVQFTTGYTDTDDVPEEIKQAIMIECGNLFDVERSSYVSGSMRKTDAFERLLMSHKIIYW